jgi:hypothetical protein
MLKRLPSGRWISIRSSCNQAIFEDEDDDEYEDDLRDYAPPSSYLLPQFLPPTNGVSSRGTSMRSPGSKGISSEGLARIFLVSMIITSSARKSRTFS